MCGISFWSGGVKKNKALGIESSRFFARRFIPPDDIVASRKIRKPPWATESTGRVRKRKRRPASRPSLGTLHEEDRCPATTRDHASRNRQMVDAYTSRHRISTDTAGFIESSRRRLKVPSWALERVTYDDKIDKVWRLFRRRPLGENKSRANRRIQWEGVRVHV